MAALICSYLATCIDHRAYLSPGEIGYVLAIAPTQRQAHGILLLGSTEPHYTASKLYPALLADRPILAAFHEASSVVDVLKRLGAAPSVIRLVTYAGAGPRTGDHVDCLARHLAAMTRQPLRPAALDLSAIEDVSAPVLARKLCGILDQICGR